jgi:hypothetical protein
MQIIMTRADFVVALSALQLFCKGFEEVTNSGVLEEIQAVTIDELLQEKVINDGIATITYTEVGVIINLDDKGLAKIYEAYDLESLGELVGTIMLAVKLGKHYQKATKKRLDKLVEDNPATQTH